MSCDSNCYGHVWTDPAKRLASIFSLTQSPSVALCEALSLGYFSQYTCYTDPALVAWIVDWQAALLTREFGLFLDFFPEDFEEKASVPSATKVRLQGRTITPDLLRNVAYALQIRALLTDKQSATVSRVLEIGSGSGSFARVYKALNPSTQIWMADLPESLRIAEIYLRESFPKAHFLFAKTPADLQGALGGIDFIFIPVDLKQSLAGHEFELALNIWSFGEMPNYFIEEWLDIIQSKCRVKFLFTINAFFAPVTVETVDRVNQGDWLFGFDDCWNIHHFKINPNIHRNPWIKNFYCGLCLFAQRIAEEDRKEQSTKARAELLNTLQEDWVKILLNKATDLARAEAKVNLQRGNPMEISEYFLAQLLATTEYIGRFNVDEGKSGTLFTLWNAYRTMRLPIAGELLACYLAMINKSLLAYRCSKEELQILKRLKISSLQGDYKAFEHCFN